MVNNIFAKRNLAPQAPQAPVAPVAPAASAPTQVAPNQGASAPVAGPILSTLTIAPWAAPANADGKLCAGCKGTGINAQQQPCRIDDSLNAKLNRPTSANWALFHDEKGMLCWETLADAAPIMAAQEAKQPVSAPVKMGEFAGSPEAAASVNPPIPEAPKRGRGRPRKTLTPAPVAQVDSVLDQVHGAQDGDGVSDTMEPDAPTPVIGRPKVGFTLLIDCAYMHGPKREVVMLSEVLHHYGEQLAQEQQASSFWALDPWKRRDALRQVVPIIAEELGSRVILCFGGDPDSKALADALAPLASMVIAGVK